MELNRRKFLGLLGAAVPVGLLGKHVVARAVDDTDTVSSTPEEEIDRLKVDDFNLKVADIERFKEVYLKPKKIKIPNLIPEKTETSFKVNDFGSYAAILNRLELESASFDVHNTKAYRDPFSYGHLAPGPMEVVGEFVFIDHKFNYSHVQEHNLLGCGPVPCVVKGGTSVYRMDIQITSVRRVVEVDAVDRLIVETISTGKVSCE